MLATVVATLIAIRFILIFIILRFSKQLTIGDIFTNYWEILMPIYSEFLLIATFYAIVKSIRYGRGD